MALLTEEQRGKLGPLETALGLRGRRVLVVKQCPAMMVSYRIARRIELDTLPVPEAKAYLGLTDGQIEKLREQRRVSEAWARQRDVRAGSWGRRREC